MSLDFWRQPSGFSDAASQAALLRDLPREPAALAKVVQGLMIHEHMPDMYGVAFDAATSNSRSISWSIRWRARRESTG